MSPGEPVVLFVDDEARILSALRRTLRREGYAIRTAETPLDALRILDTEPVDVVVTDQKMPGMSGLQLLEQVRRRRPETVRILLTGWTEAVPPEQVRALDIRAVIPKPWDEGELRSILRKAVGTGP